MLKIIVVVDKKKYFLNTSHERYYGLTDLLSNIDIKPLLFYFVAEQRACKLLKTRKSSALIILLMPSYTSV